MNLTRRPILSRPRPVFSPAAGRFLFQAILFALLIAFVAPSAAWSAGAPASADEAAPIPAGDAYDDTAYDDPSDAEESVVIADPLAPFNQVMFEVNDAFYFYMLKPVSIVWREAVPSDLRGCVFNFFQNLGWPIRLVSCVLQGKMEAAGTETARFLINTTLGVGGLGDPATAAFHIAPKDEDLGQTFGVWGLGHGCYIVWPLLGPSTLRDTLGLLGDRFLDPVTYVQPWETALAITAGDTVNRTSFRIGDYETIKDAAFVPYDAFKDAYIQHRNKKTSE